MSPEDPRHGSYAGAVAHWRDGEPACDRCAPIARRERKRRHLAAMRGRPSLVPLGDRAWRILAQTPNSVVSAQTGILRPKLITYQQGGPEKIVNRRTRDRILAVDGWTYVGIVRRLRALHRIGWSSRALAPEVGCTVEVLRKLTAGGCRDFITHQVGEAIVDTYARLHMTPIRTGRGPSRAINRAVAEGWPPPLAWDNIDDPDERPEGLRRDWHSGPGHNEIDFAVVDRVLAGENLPTTSAERAEICRRWVASGGSLRRLEKRLGWKPDRYFQVGEEGAA